LRLLRSSITITSGLNRKSGCRRKSPTPQQTSRELSVCGHVVANDELLVVEDLSRDRRFANNPLLKERGLRFYAGVPLRSNNLPIGSLCILDVKPRRMTEREKRLLEVIGEDVMEEIKRRDSVGPPSVLVA
jgi:GAF domain-containing protein